MIVRGMFAKAPGARGTTQQLDAPSLACLFLVGVEYEHSVGSIVLLLSVDTKRKLGFCCARSTSQTNDQPQGELLVNHFS